MAKYDKWVEAKQQQHAARLEHSDSEGGSTKDRILETKSLLKQADSIEAERWEDLKKED